MSRMKKSNTGLIILIGVLLAAIVFLVLILVPLKNMKLQKEAESENAASDNAATEVVSETVSADTVSAAETVSSNTDSAVDTELKYIDDVIKYTDANLDKYSRYEQFSDASGTKFRNAEIYVDDKGYPVKMEFNPDSMGLTITSYYINKDVDGRNVIEPYYYDNNLVYVFAADEAGNSYSIYCKGERNVASPLGRVIAYDGMEGDLVQFPEDPNFYDFLKKYENTPDATIITDLFDTAAPKWDILFEDMEASSNSVN